MNNTVKKILIWIASIIGIGVTGYVGFLRYMIFTFSSGCGMNDGPFNAVLIEKVELTETAKIFDL